MEMKELNTAINFALDLQEEIGQTGEFEPSLKTLLRKYIHNINLERTTNEILVFNDNSGCVFEGHDVRIIDSVN